jgi:hypothetical protein
MLHPHFSAFPLVPTHWILLAEWTEGRTRYRKYWTNTEFIIHTDASP